MSSENNAAGQGRRSQADLTPACVRSEDLPGAEREGARDYKREPEAVPARQAKARPTVLVVEHAVELAVLLCTTLEMQGMRVLHAAHAERALQLLRANGPDVILLECDLPNDYSERILDEVNSGNADVHPSVVLMVSQGDANEQLGNPQGVFSRLLKPVTPEQVVIAVKRALAARSQGFREAHWGNANEGDDQTGARD